MCLSVIGINQNVWYWCFLHDNIVGEWENKTFCSKNINTPQKHKNNLTDDVCYGRFQSLTVNYLDECSPVLYFTPKVCLKDWNRYHITGFRGATSTMPFYLEERLRASEMFLTSAQITVKTAALSPCHLWLGVLQEDPQEKFARPSEPWYTLALWPSSSKVR